MSDKMSYSIESQISYSLNDDDILTSITKQIAKKNDEIISETIVDHFQTDLSTFREFLAIKGNGGYMYLCCEENYNGLGSQEGAVSELVLKSNIYDAFWWFIERLKRADENNNTVIDEENIDYRFYKSKIDMVSNRFFGEVEEFGRTSVVVFFDEQENFEYHYEIVVRKIKVF